MNDGVISSLQEKLGLQMKDKNILRPEFEEIVLLFKYLWKERNL
jgi:hypothetical protein